MAKSLSAHEYTLSKIFAREYEFNIPEYQRPYRWGTSEALQLLDDLEETLDREDGEPYFLGSLVLVEQGETMFDVIDGQQRLTTLTILFAVLRDLATDPEIVTNLGDTVRERGSKLDGIAAKPRLTLRMQDARFFNKYVQSPGMIEGLIGLGDAAAATEPQRAIRDNAKALHERLTDWDESRRTVLAGLMRMRTYLVVVTTPDLNSAYRIFSVMNARGLDLAPTDIFKSKVIGKLPPDSGYAKMWEDAEEALGSDAFTDLFRDIRTIESGERARLELLREFPEQVLNPYLDDGRPSEFIDDLLMPYAQAFESVSACEVGPGPEWDQVNDWLRRLGMIDNKDWRPVALWALANHENDTVFLAAFLRKLERLAAMFLLRGEYTTPRVARYLGLLANLKDGLGLESPSFELTDVEKAATRAALDGEIYYMQAKRARYVLLRLDELLSKDPGVTYKHAIISIEHVLPQSPAEQSQWVQDFTVEERAHWTHRLGNLLLLNRRKNSQLQNHDFTTKKKRYFSGGSAVFALTTQVLGYDEWTPSIVAQRQHELVHALSQEWELN